jgi:hypothetical protein
MYRGDSVLELTPDASQLRANYTPADQGQLETDDIDLGSTAPALVHLGRRLLAVQGGKDGWLRLLDVGRLNGQDGRAGPQTGGELDRIRAPGASGLFSAPAVIQGRGEARLFVGSSGATAAYRVLNSAEPRIQLVWQNEHSGTSPVMAGGLVFVYDPSAGVLNVYRPASSRPIATLPARPGHWNSPIVVGGRILLPEGSANSPSAHGTLDLYSLPPG